MVELPLLGVLGDLVVEPLDEPEPIEPDELPPVEPEVLPEEPDEPVEPDEPDELLPPLELEEPDLLKCASHSVREIWPSLLVSTDEKLGALELLDEPLGELEDELDEPPAALDGELDEPVDGELDELPLADGVEGDELPDLAASAATASVDSAKSTAAVVTLTVLSIENSSKGWGKPPTTRKRRAADLRRAGKISPGRA